jgi:hypothetical protein
MGKIERHQDSKRDLQKSNQRKESTRQAAVNRQNSLHKTAEQAVNKEAKQAVNRKQGPSTREQNNRKTSPSARSGNQQAKSGPKKNQSV